jgi:hypothetical protein
MKARMLARTLRTIPCIAALALVLAPIGGATGAQQLLTPFNETDTNPCNGEDVGFNGFLHMVVRLGRDSVDGFHEISVANGQGISGVGLTSGSRYSLSTVSSSVINVKVAVDSFEFTQLILFNVVSQSSVDNWYLQLNAHITFVDGTTKVDFVHENENECRG